MQESSKLDEETKDLTFGCEVDLDAFKQASEAALEYHKKYVEAFVCLT